MLALNLSPLLITVSWSSLLIIVSQAQNVQVGQWQLINYTSKSSITERQEHAGVFLSSTDEYLVFSGENVDFLSDFHSINPTSQESTLLAASTPLGRRGGMAFTSDLVSTFYLHGGGSVNCKF
jgi:hypothetical protein